MNPYQQARANAQREIISDKIIQLTFGDVWWQIGELWRDRSYKRDLTRPTEIAALRNIYYEVVALTGDYRNTLTDIEREIDALDKLYSRRNYSSPKRRYEDIAKAYSEQYKGNMTITQVKSILDSISFVMRTVGYERAIEVEKSRMRQVVKKVA